MKGQIKKNINIIHPELSYKLNGIFFKVHSELGRFCREKQYSDALEKKLQEEKINYKRESRIERGEEFTGNITDFIIEDLIIVDVKAKKFVTKDDFYQMKRYLKSLGKQLGMIVNFRDNFIKTKRILSEIS